MTNLDVPPSGGGSNMLTHFPGTPVTSGVNVVEEKWGKQNPER